MLDRPVAARVRGSSLAAWFVHLLLPVVAGCAPGEADAVRWHEADAARIDAFDHWLGEAVGELPGVTRKDVVAESLVPFYATCETRLRDLGVVMARVAYAHAPLAPGATPATALCTGFSTPGWTKDGQSAIASGVERDGRNLGWGRYWDEGSYEPGYEVWWRFEAGDAIVQVGLLLPEPTTP